MLSFFVQRKNSLILIFTIAYLAAFAINAFFQANLEFLYYTILMIGLIYLIVIINKHLHLAFFILVNLSLLGFLSLLGGNFYIGETRLFDFYFIPGVIRYDNIVHVYSTFIVTLILYSLLDNFIDEKIRQNYLIFSLILVLMAIGVGTVSELVEFAAVVFFDAAEKVGGYFNNALDLVFNTLGSILACIIIYIYREKPSFKRKLYENYREDN